MSEIRIPLSAPITAHGEEITELVLRKPTTAESRAVGVLPYRIGAANMPEINVPASCQYISKCAGIPPSSVDLLDVADLNAACWAVAGFFLNPGSPTSDS
ncbi:phage tail assembly protein [Chromobacterium sp. S0633]|uniref:phage tail assembly protein n=1 Tax=Chromobacterium sp. S0633 TaxID=2957805 RepID=UPI0020A2209B|nr:phage tail assembly protein [Chromobacterium sp. S0633]MCP1289819.1 phage tail assembly protein [Chromobacterium sp. S0633]